MELVRTAEGIGAMSAGHAMWLELDLAAGTWSGACFLPTPDGTPHAMLGMLTAFEVE